MEIINQEVTSYFIKFWNGTQITGDKSSGEPHMWLTCNNGSIADIVFIEDDQAVPQPSLWQLGQGPVKKQCVTVWFKLREYARLVDMLRNEKPVYLYVLFSQPQNAVFATIGTQREPVGEEEQST